MYRIISIQDIYKVVGRSVFNVNKASNNPKTVSLLKTATHTFATRKNLPGSLLQKPEFCRLIIVFVIICI